MTSQTISKIQLVAAGQAAGVFNFEDGLRFAAVLGEEATRPIGNRSVDAIRIKTRAFLEKIVAVLSSFAVLNSITDQVVVPHDASKNKTWIEHAKHK